MHAIFLSINIFFNLMKSKLELQQKYILALLERHNNMTTYKSYELLFVIFFVYL